MKYNLDFLSPQMYNGLYGQECATHSLPIATVQIFFFHVHLNSVIGDKVCKRTMHFFSPIQIARMHNAFAWHRLGHPKANSNNSTHI
jgi:hypothetical protein